MRKYACVDVTGSSRAIDVVTATEQASDSLVVDHRQFSSVAAVAEWLVSENVDLIAVDGPSKPNAKACRDAATRARHQIPSDKYADFRLCEAILRMRGIGLYHTRFVDDLGTLATAIAVDKGRAHGVGDAREGTIVIPGPLQREPYRAHANAT